MHDLKVALVQSDIKWHDIHYNIRMFERKLLDFTTEADLVLLPEMFTTGFTMDAGEFAETMNGKTIEWMLSIAAEINAVITGSIIIKEADKYFNRLIWARPDGTLDYYDKRHLFSMAGEEKVYTPGNKKLIVELNGWKICPMICYDLRFPAWVRNQENYDLSVFVASWPEKRISHWRKLIQARSIENQCYTIGVNRIGSDNNEINYNGSSMIIDPMGEIKIEMILSNSVVVKTLYYDEITRIRRYMPFLKDQDNYAITD